MRVGVTVLLLLLASGCAARRVVRLDTGHGTPISYTPIESAPVQAAEDVFASSVAEIVLGLRLDVGLGGLTRDERLSLLAGGLVDGVRGPSVRSSLSHRCSRRLLPEECLLLLSSGGAWIPGDRQALAIAFAFDTLWEGVAETVAELANPDALRAMVVSLVGTALVMLVAPEPVTKLIAIGLTASLIAYLGTGPVWKLGQGFLRLRAEARGARSIGALEDAGHRFGKVLGENGARVLVLVALTALGGKNALAAQGPRLPGFAQAAARARIEAGLELSGALAGEVRALALPAAGVLNIVLAPTAVAAVAMGPGSAIQGDPEGDVHHICTNKNEVSETSGGPWTPQFEKLFEQAGMRLGDSANMVRIQGHRGPHPAEYHHEILRRLVGSMKGCRGEVPCRAALVETLAEIARELTTAGTRLRKLITRNPEAHDAMTRRFFDLSMDVYVPGRWSLAEPRCRDGRRTDDIWQFIEGREVENPGPLHVPLFRAGRPLDLEFAGAGQAPVVSERVAKVFRDMAPDDVQLFEVDVEGQREPYFLLNVTRTVRCIDDAACEEVRHWTSGDGRPDRVGEYRVVAGLRIDPSMVGDMLVFRLWGWSPALIVDESIKEVLERKGILGGRFDAV